MNLQELRELSHRVDDPRELALYVLKNYTQSEDIHAKVDIFLLCRNLEVFYMPLDLEGIDGLYNNGNKTKKAFIGLNSNQKIRRMKFTLAHELCHHIKDYRDENHFTLKEKTNRRTPYNGLESFANRFAAEILIPHKEFKAKLQDYTAKGFIEKKDLCKLADYFEVSYSSIKKRAETFGEEIIEDNDYFQLDEKIDFKIKLQYINSLLHQEFFELDKIRKKCIKDIVENDSRFEGANLSTNEISELLFDKDNLDKTSLTENQVEILGLNYIYNSLMHENNASNQYKLKSYYSNLYKFANYEVIEYRKSNAIITGSNITTVPFEKIDTEMYYLFKRHESLFDIWNDKTDIKNFNELSESHQGITSIHPFPDGNGRMSRFLLNWVLKINSLPFMIISLDKKNKYLKDLSQADIWNFEPLSFLFIDSLYDSINTFITKYNV